ncbi:O-unit flippase-like protein [Vibrio nigripulchritudo]|uniref:O-unit flippase-like protein n=1 Tax=Vibrio nigripulchritudo TaxID=28173 RepID=UPI0005FA4ECB|nr:O-unit flippase-like protein [Vibrio nigripulchritudo]KJY79066.1 hypothetical protein TW74_10270 [Vibrio nigripulchritudo]
MMHNKDLFWGYLSQFLQYGAALIVLPVMLYFLSPSQLGIWYVFMTISNFVTMVDLSLTPIISRNVSCYMVGATTLEKSGYSNIEVKDINKIDIYGTYQASKYIFRLFSLVLILLFFTFGSSYIENIITPDLDKEVVMISWYIFAFSTAIDLYFKYINGFLQGSLNMVGYYKVIALTRVSFVLMTSVLIACDFGLLGISIAYIISVILSRLVAWSYFKSDLAYEVICVRNFYSFESVKKNLYLLWNSSQKVFIASIGGFLILKSSTLVSSTYLSLEQTASFALTMQVLTVLTALSSVYLNTRIPAISRLRVRDDLSSAQSLISKGMVVAILVYILGCLIFLLLGKDLLYFMGSKTDVLSYFPLIVLMLIMLLEMNHSLAATVIISGNDVPFVKASIFSGLLVFLFSILMINYTNLGLWSLILSQGIVQLSYNNWKWPIYMANSLGSNFFLLVIRGVKGLRNNGN